MLASVLMKVKERWKSWLKTEHSKSWGHGIWSHSVHSVAQSCPTLCDSMNHSTPGLPVHHQLLEFTQTHIHRVKWCHPAILSSLVPFSSCPQSLPASESFPMSQLFAWGGQSTGISALAWFLSKKSQQIDPSKEIPASRWENNGNRQTDFILGGSKITADGDFSHEIKRCLLLGRKAMTNLDSIWKSRDITLPTKVHLVKTMVFPIVKYGRESWTIKKAEHWQIDAFKLWCWGRLLRVPWTARRSNLSVLKEISPEYSLEGQMAEAETPVLWPPDFKNHLIGKDPDAGKDWRQEEKGMTEDEMVGWHHHRDG